MSTLGLQARRIAVGAGSAVAAAAVVVGSLGFFSAADPGRAATTSVDTTYLSDTLGLPADTVIDTVTYDRFQWLLRQPGQFAFLIGSKTDAGFAAQAQAVDAAAKAAGATKVYWFDPNLTGETGVKNLDTRNSTGINLASSSQTIYGNVWRNVLGQSLGNGIQSVSNSAGNSVTITANDAVVNDSVDPAWDFRTGQTQAISSTQNALIVFDKDNQVTGAPDKIVDWVNLSTDASIATSVADAFTAIGGGAVIDQVAEFDWWKSENNRIQSLSTPVARYGGDILADADDDLGWNVEQLTYPELLHLLKLQDSADRNFVILFGGTWCPNTRAVIKFLNADAVENGVKVYNFDLVLDGGKVNGTNGGSNPIHVRDNANSGATFNFRPSWVYGDVARTYLRNLITQYDPHSGNRVSYYPNGDLTAFPDVVRKLQVPFLINYQRGTGSSVSSTAIKRQWIKQVVDPSTGLVSYQEYMTNWWFTQPSDQLGLNFAIPADESTLSSSQQSQLAQARANVAFAQEALTKLDEFFAGLPGTVSAAAALTAPPVGADTAPTVSLALSNTYGRTATGSATLTVNGSSYNAPLASNAATFALPKLAPGTYPLSVTYPGDANLSAFTATGSLTVTAVPVFSGPDTVYVTPEPVVVTKPGATTTVVVTVTEAPSEEPAASPSPSQEPSDEPSPSATPSVEPSPSEAPLPSAPDPIVAAPAGGEGGSGGAVTTWIIVGGGILGAAGLALGGIQFFRQRWGGGVG